MVVHERESGRADSQSERREGISRERGRGKTGPRQSTCHKEKGSRNVRPGERSGALQHLPALTKVGLQLLRSESDVFICVGEKEKKISQVFKGVDRSFIK